MLFLILRLTLWISVIVIKQKYIDSVLGKIKEIIGYSCIYIKFFEFSVQ